MRLVETPDELVNITDGCYTFGELYYQRTILVAALCRAYRSKAWKSRNYSDIDNHEGRFLVGIDTPNGNYTVHIKNAYWDLFDITELAYAPEADTDHPMSVDRLLSLSEIVD